VILTCQKDLNFAQIYRVAMRASYSVPIGIWGQERLWCAHLAQVGFEAHFQCPLGCPFLHLLLKILPLTPLICPIDHPLFFCLVPPNSSTNPQMLRTLQLACDALSASTRKIARRCRAQAHLTYLGGALGYCEEGNLLNLCH